MIKISSVALAELHSLYSELEQALEPLRGKCEASGRCCHFQAWGHKLYLTALEAAAMDLQRLGTVREAAAQGCPHLQGTLCSQRENRALGCRIYFCDRTHEDARNALYEDFLKRLRLLEARHGIETYYAGLDAWSADPNLPRLAFEEDA